mmetsp:Transcript_5801/g.11337  ORF Transcript_5801/g.11337 Transcript_5801/m.11337 type:complete len:214 (-) Transcript_5801:2593-3234(-)
MNLGHPSRRSGTDSSSYVSSTLLVFVQFTSGRHDAGETVAVCAHIFGFLLSEDNLCVLVPCTVGRHAIKGKRSNLFQTHQGNILLATLFALGEKLVVYLTIAENKSLDSVRILTDFRIRFIDHTLELGFRSHVVECRDAPLVTKEVLRRHDNQRLAEITVNLTTQDMEVLCWSCAINNLPVAALNLHTMISSHLRNVVRIFVDLLQETLKTAR